MRHYSRTKLNGPTTRLARFTLTTGLIVAAWSVTTDRVHVEAASNRDLLASHFASPVENSSDGDGREEPCAAGVAGSSVLVEFDLHKRSAKALNSLAAVHSTPCDPRVDEGRASFRGDTTRTPSYIALRRLLL